MNICEDNSQLYFAVATGSLLLVSEILATIKCTKVNSLFDIFLMIVDAGVGAYIQKKNQSSTNNTI